VTVLRQSAVQRSRKLPFAPALFSQTDRSDRRGNDENDGLYAAAGSDFATPLTTRFATRD